MAGKHFHGVWAGLLYTKESKLLSSAPCLALLSPENKVYLQYDTKMPRRVFRDEVPSPFFLQTSLLSQIYAYSINADVMSSTPVHIPLQLMYPPPHVPR